MNCPEDCGDVCGDGVCAASESHCSCPDDCPHALYTDWETGGWEGWTASAVDNWYVSTDYIWNTSYHAHFSWSPRAYDYSYTLTSPVIDLEGCYAVDMVFQLAFSDFDGTGNNNLYIECTSNGVDWVSVSSFTGWNQSQGTHEPGEETSWLDPCSDSSTVKVRFRVTGDDSYGINYFAFDNVDIHRL